MRKDTTTVRLAVGVPILAAFFWITGSPAPKSAPPAIANACATWAEDSVATKKDRVEFMVKYSEPLGEKITASFPKAAQIDVISAARAAEPQSAKLVLNTVRAVAGKWVLTLTGDTQDCVGDIYVGVKKPVK
jgi:hypothetical protein